MKCPYCGHEVDQHDHHCKTCGRSLNQLHQEKKLVKVSAVIVVFICFIGGAFLLINAGKLENVKSTKSKRSNNEVVSASTQNAQTETPVETDEIKTPNEGSIAAAEKKAEENQAAEAAGFLTASISNKKREQIAGKGFTKTEISSSKSSSSLGGKKYSAGAAIDGDETTSWQDGKKGNGEGAKLTYGFPQKEKVKYIFFKLGNWKKEDSYRKNNRPSKITISIGGESTQVTFPDHKQEYCVELSKTVRADEISFIIDEVYQGDSYKDTCISEIEIDSLKK